MALNFPANTTLPYVDPVSGLKYIYNDSVGAWEAAIQPPAIVSSDPPAITIPGFLWWDDVGGSLYVWYQDADGGQWVDASPSGENVASAYISQNAPEGALPGELWWNNDNGRLYVYYDDGDSQQWIQAYTPDGSGVTVNQGLKMHSGAATPTNAKKHDLWFNTTDRTLYAFIGDTPEWTKTNNIINPSSFVTSVTATSPISIGGTAKEPNITVDVGSTTVTGVVRLSTVNEAKTGLDKTNALSPGVLKEAIATSPTTYLPAASSTQAGVASFATTSETTAGALSNKAVTPQSLKASLPSMGLSVPVGTVITNAGAVAPNGYLACDGALLSRTTYSALFQVIGTTYGIGDGTTTFKLPTVTGGTFNSYIKF